MTKDEAIRILDPKTFVEELVKIEYYGGFAGWTKAAQAVYDACILAAEALREQGHGRWIPVTERLPKNFISVLGYMTDAGKYPPVRECYTVGNAFFFPALGDVHPVSHWCEMPQPPKEEGT